jgi:hypothetical protein
MVHSLITKKTTLEIREMGNEAREIGPWFMVD